MTGTAPTRTAVGTRRATVTARLGWCVVAATVLTIVLIGALHLLRSDLDPRSHAISEYANGPHGALMTVVFFCQSVGSLALAAGVISAGLEPRRTRLGAALMALSAIGAAFAGVFPTDATTPPETFAGTAHLVAGLVRFLSLCVALPILTSALATGRPWKRVAPALRLLAALFVMACLGSLVVLTQVDLFGFGQRTFIGILLTWSLLAAYPMTRPRPETR